MRGARYVALDDRRVLAFVGAGAFMSFIERRLLALWQDRYGPNRVGPFGLLQLAADMVKMFFKEDWIPPFADRRIFVLAPIIAFTAFILAFAVVPISPTWGVADLNVGLLYILAIAGLASSFMFTLVVPIQSKLPELLDASREDSAWVVTATLLAAAVITPNITGTPVSSEIFAIPFETSDATYSKCGVPPRMTTPSASTTSYLPDDAIFDATSGISNAPGTHATSTSSSATP